MSISIVIPNYNRTDKLERAVRSVFIQKIQDLEVIVVDDGSDDQTLKFYEQLKLDYPVRIINRDRSPKGANMCRSIGFENAKGTFIKWLDSDDELIVDSLKRQEEYLLSEEIDVVVGNAQVHDWRHGLEGKYIKDWSENIEHDNLLKAYIKGWIRWPSGAPLWRRNFFHEAPFNPKQMNSQEWLMHCEAISKKPRVKFLNEPTLKVHIGTDRLSSYIHRNASYFYNQSLARFRALRFDGLTLGLKLELLKLAMVYLLHGIYRKVVGKPFS